ncbi:hypothetical protein HY251_20310 [bacterium]|nr:hypothetical protein [bacterium]
MRTAYVAALAGSVLALSLSSAQDAPEIAWLTDLASAREQARGAKKPLLVVFR